MRGMQRGASKESMSRRLLFDRVESRAMGRPPRDMRSPLDRRSNQLFNVGRTIGLIMAHLMAHALMAHALMSDPELGRRAHLLGRRKSWPRTQCARATPAATAGAGSLMAVMMRHTARARDQPNRLMLRGQSMIFMHATPSSPLRLRHGSACARTRGPARTHQGQ